MAAKKQDAKTPITELTATERTLLEKMERLEHRQILTEEALRLVTNSVLFLLDLQSRKYSSLPEGDSPTKPKETENPSLCRCHALPPTCGSLQPYPIANDSGAL